MSLGLIGRKVGMTRVFTEDGASVPVTVLEVVPNRVTQIKTTASDGYTSLQVAYGERRASRINKALTGIMLSQVLLQVLVFMNSQ